MSFGATPARAAAAITTQPVSQLVTTGQPATFTVAASGGGSLTYQWHRSSFPIAGAVGATYTIPQASRSDAGIYDVAISDGSSTTLSDGVKLNVAPSSYPNAVQADLAFAPRLEVAGGTVNAIFPTADGNFIVSGDFTQLNGVARPGLARVDENFVVDATFVPPPFFADADSGINAGRLVAITRVMAIQPDGKILVTHVLPTTDAGLQRNTLVRLLADGSVDATFSASAEPVNIIQLALQPDGRIIVLGFATSVALPAGKRYVYRLMADGTLDEAYAPVFGTAAAPAAPAGVTVQPDGMALFAYGTGGPVNGQTVGSVVRLTADGVIDPTFTLSGIQQATAVSVAVQPDGKILVGGDILVTDHGSTKLIRITASGAWEASLFGSSEATSAVSRISFATNGKIWVGARDSSGLLAVWRLSAAGAIEQKFSGYAPDPAWGLCPISGDRLLVGTGTVISQPSSAARYAANGAPENLTATTLTTAGIQTAATAPGGKCYVSGSFTQVDGVTSNRLARLNADGTLDAAFAVGTGFDQAPQCLLVLPDGRLIAGGYFTTYQQQPVPRLVCLQADGMLDATFSATPPPNTYVTELALLRDGRLLVNSSLCYAMTGTQDTTFAPVLDGLFGAQPLPDGGVLAGSVSSTSGLRVALLRSDGTTRQFAGLSLRYFTSLGVQPDGKILVGGMAYLPPSSGDTYPAVIRFDASLAYDTNFIPQGIPAPAYTVSSYRGPQMLVQEDGRILINDFYGSARLGAGGGLDPTFVQTGVRPVGATLLVRGFLSMLLRDDGSLLVGDDTMEAQGLRRRGLVRLIDASVISSQPQEQHVTSGAAVNLSVGTTGSGAVTYQWYKNGAPLAGATSATLSLSGVTAADAGGYFATVTNATGTVRSADAAVYVTTVAPVSQQITFAPVADHTYGDSPFPVSATSDSGLAVTLTVVSGPAALDAGYLRLTGAGTVTLRATQPGTASVLPAADVERTFTVAKAALTATAVNQVRAFGVANPFLEVTYQGFVGNDNIGTLTPPWPMGSTTATVDSPYGVYPITVTGGSSDNYEITRVNGTLTIIPPSYNRTYFGTVTPGGYWALYVRADGTATFAFYFVGQDGGGYQNLTVQADGTFTAGSTGNSTGTVSSLSLAGPEAPTRHADVVVAIPLSGRIAADGTVTGSFGSGASPNMLTGAADDATPSAPAGVYRVTALNAATGTSAATAIVGPSGQAVFVTSGAMFGGASGTVDAFGQLTATTSTGGSLALTINAAAQTLTATLTPSGSATPISYAGLPDGVASTSRVVNLSVRSPAGTGSQTLIVGFVVTGAGGKNLLLRGVGPGLAQYLSNPLADPYLRLLDGTGAELEANNDWSGTLGPVIVSLGASAFGQNSKDAAILRSVSAGAYSYHVYANDGGTGVTVAELYDADATATPAQVVNISARTQVGTGSDILIAGFVVTGNAPKTLLIRGLGPTLTALNVAGALADPQLYLYQGNTVIATNDNWGGTGTLVNAFATVGAGDLVSGSSKDAALLVTVNPGVYSAQVSGVNSTTGVGLVEIYLLP